MEETVTTSTTVVEEQPKKIIRPMNLRHREIISRLIYYNQSPAEIAEELGFSRGGIDRIIRSPLFQAELQKELLVKQRMERDSVIQQVANEGVKKLHEAVTTGKLVYVAGEKVEEKALDGREIVAIIHDSLDRTGHKPVTKVLEGHFDLGAMVIEAHQRAKESSELENSNEIENSESIIEAEIVQS